MTARQIDQNIGQRIKLLRKHRGWSQPELGKMLGKSNASISYMESGHRAIKINDLLKVARIFNVSASNFLEGLYYERV